jgi:ketosteroid isomerase-like protein
VDPLEVVTAFGTAWADHDLDGALSWMSDDCLFESTGPSPDGIGYHGRTDVRAAWQSIFDDRHSVFETEETFVAGNRVVQRWRYAWEDGHVRGIDVFEVQDGKISQKLSYVKG